MDKKIIYICLLTFVIGCIGGGTLAYANHQKGLESQTLLASIAQTQDEWEVEQFIREQEEQRPDGMEESQIATGSRYTGITYNNVSTATVGSNNSTNNTKGFVTDDNQSVLSNSSDNEKSETNKDSNQAASQNTQANKVMGRVDIQTGSLNIRSANSIGDNVIGQAYKDELLEIIHQDGVWYQVITADGVQGYVSSTYVEIINE